ncbi:DUF986 family protein [Celerinatantimonas diazotrophica]|uniref:UPF0266 membrane protein EV690_1551 n=1 Tax=Celerinatantimonas diazotrophica TaxID=412034 RepID=A0A4R1K2D4_9GAMM|nr:DUF986 family protein [Celerinatantimonas diazotrophica]TCK57853.1 uncharacterized membrane protein YobD (UPF0266 family) [Celerinatantimonas diazotrophica]CAG9298082.1 hypothetical protein CEDIAZO_03277 [Celerinatantimonas diazotrophica]
MSLTDWVLLGCIVLMLAYAIYDEFIMPRRRGETLLRVQLLRKTRLDCLIFVALIGILIYQNITTGGTTFTTYLLTTIAFVAIYLAYIRPPKMLFKPEGFFFANAFIAYNRIKTMKLSEDGVLVFGLNTGNIPVELHRIDDLDKITALFSPAQGQTPTLTEKPAK